MSEDFVLNKDTDWKVDLSDDTKVELNTTLYRERLVVEVLEIEMTISTDEDLRNSFKATHTIPNPNGTTILSVIGDDIAKLYSELYEYLDRLNKE